MSQPSGEPSFPIKVSDTKCSKEGCSEASVFDPERDAEALQAEMNSLKPGFWTLSDDKRAIHCNFTCRNFKAAIAFFNAVAEIAEDPDMNHHPDLHLTSYKNVMVRIYTFSAGGLTKHDFKLARALDTIEVDYSPAWLKKLNA
jgi:4a-hydroxytetrahydrobiopterin dehydratase